MAYLSDYFAGTVTSIGLVITGTGTGWQTAGFREGDIFIADGWWARIASVDSNTQITIDENGGSIGAALSDAPYRLRYMSDGSRSSAQARQLIDTLGGSGNLEALGGLAGLPDNVIMFTGPGTMTLVPRTELVSGVAYDVQVANIAARAAYNGQAEGFSVLVSNVGDGRSAIYSRVGAAGNWSDPAYITGPSLTLDVDQVDPLPYGDDPTVTLNSIAGGYELNFGIPQGMEIVPGTVTTLSPGASATVDFVPVTGGYQLDFGLPKGDTGTIAGLTPFYQTQVTTAADDAAARAGLGVGTVGTINLPPSPVGDVLLDDGTWGEVDGVGELFDTVIATTPAQQGQARANISAGILSGFRNKIINGCGEVAQRTPGVISHGDFLCDHWQYVRDGAGTFSWQTLPFGSSSEQIPGNPRTYLSVTQSVASGGTYNVFRLPMEGVNTLAGRKATVTLYARFPTGPGDTILQLELRQNFGTGGTPSAAVATSFGEGGTTPGTQFSKVQFVVDVPSIASKTIGSNNNDCLELYIYLPTDTAFVFDITKVSVVEGDATAEDDPFSPRHIQQEISLCQRYYEISAMDIPDSGNTVVGYWAVEKRVAPSISISGGVVGTGGALTPSSAAPTRAFRIDTLASGGTRYDTRVVGDAEL